jgi:hypothetical protein
MRARAAALPALLLACACSGPSVSVRRGYDFAGIRRVAVLGFADYPGQKNSGALVCGAFGRSLLAAGWEVVEREQAGKLLREQAFQLSGAVDPRQAKRIGQMLGVDALVLGEVTDFSPPRSGVVMADVPDVVGEPVTARRVRRVKQGDQWVDVSEDVVTRYQTQRHNRKVPSTYTVDALVGASVRMVSVETGELLWSGSYSRRESSAGEAAAVLARKVVQGAKPAWPARK